MLKRFFVLILSSFLLCGCGDKSNKESVTFASWGSITEVGIINELILGFEAENPNIEVNFMHVPQNYFQKMHLLFASNTAPDVVFINNLYLPMYAPYLEDLSKSVVQKEFYPQAVEGLSYDGKILAIPRDISNLVFYVNTDLIKLKKDWTLEDLQEIAKNATTKDAWTLGLEDDIYWTLPYLSYYGEVFDEEFVPENSNGFKFYRDLRDKYRIAPTKSQIGSSTLAQMFLDKKIAMYLSGRWMYPKISEKADFNWQIVSFPKGEGKLPCDASGWAISKNSKHKKAALSFVEYISNEKSAEYFAKTGLIVPARISASNKLDNNGHNEKVFLETIKDSKNTYVFKDYKKTVDIFNARNF